MSDQTVIEPTTTSAPDATALSPAESFANEVAAPVASTSDTSAATSVAAASDGAADVASQPAAAPIVAAGAASQPAVAASAVQQDISASVKDFTQAFNFVEQGVEKLGVAAKDELIALARKYL
ncbi:hypothetical protein ACCY16_19765 [Candidatus Pantoea formicae]|uniref:hypothetical protein n=1 Tax=Candidatus Pantoea formicae TaxID=2608355 RepID=UPI003EDA1805